MQKKISFPKLKRHDYPYLMSDMLSFVKRDARLIDVVEKLIGISDKKSRPPKALCPFHDDTHPSLNVYPNLYRCFACDSHGDVVDFVRNYYKISFIQAVEWLYYDYLGYEPRKGGKPIGLSEGCEADIPPLTERYPTIEERIAACAEQLPFEDFATFLILDRIDPWTRENLALHAIIVGGPKDPVKWLSDFFGLNPNEPIEAIRIWESWVRRAPLYFPSLSWARGFRKILKARELFPSDS